MKTRKLLLAAFAALAVGVVAWGPVSSVFPAAMAQNLGARKVSGTVIGPNSAPVAGATVFLKSLKTKSIRSFTSVENGHFNFAQVNKAEDYDLWAEKDGKKTAIKTVSSWDARNDFVTELKLK